MVMQHQATHGIPLGLPNQEGGPYIYDGTPIPPTPPEPTVTRKKHKFPWVIYANKLRKRLL